METAAEKCIGIACELKSLVNDHLGVGVIGDADDASGTMDIIPRGGDLLPTLAYNQAVKIICHAPKIGFRLFLGRVYLSSRSLMRVVDVGTHQSIERRQYFRLNLQHISCEITRHSASTEENAEPEIFSVSLLDVSLGGIRILTKAIFAPKDKFIAQFTLIKQEMEMVCEICREVFQEATRPGEHQYGCRFIDMSEKQLDKICSDLFELQRLEIRKKKDRIQ